MPKAHSRDNRQEKDNALNTGSRDIAWTVNAAVLLTKWFFSYKKAAYDNHKAEYPVYLSDEKACSQALYKPF